jgi:ribosomal protein S6--L-glutamate ligase
MGTEKMIIGIMTVNGFDFHPNKRLLESAKSCGHEILLINPYEMLCTLEKGNFDFLLGSLGRVPDVILPRQGSPMGEYGFVLLRHFVQMGIPLINGLEGVMIAKNQYITLQTLATAGIPIPDTCFITRKTNFFKAIQKLDGYPVIAKQVDGMGGDGVAKIETRSQALGFLDNHLNPLKGMLVQRFINPGGRKDLRMLVIGGRLVGAMTLMPRPGEFRANIHQNGRADAFDPPEKWAKLALDSAAACCLEIAGVDMILEKNGDPLVVEVNYSPGFRGLEEAIEKDISQEILDYVVAFAKTKTRNKNKKNKISQ